MKSPFTLTTLCPVSVRLNGRGRRATASGLIVLVFLLTAGRGFSADPTGGTGSGDAGTAQAPQPAVPFGGPASTGAQLKADAEVKGPLIHWPGLERVSTKYFDSKDNLQQSTGLSLGGDYFAMFQGVSESPGDDFAASGDLRVFATWDLISRDTANTGSAVFKVENRHLLGTDLSPQALGSEVGYAGLTAITFSDSGWLLTNLYWQQHLLDGKLAFLAGVLDVTDYVDLYSLANPWAGFSNLSFSINPTIALPNQGLGVTVRGLLTDHVYIIGGIEDANGDPSDPGGMFDSFFSTGETFKHLEVGWVGSWDNRFEDNIHVTVWQQDEREEAGIAEGSGVSFLACRLLGDRWMPFAQVGFSDGGGGTFLDRSVSVGTGVYFRDKSDQLGVGLNWGRPSEETLGPGLRDQYTFEVFYRCQVLKHLILTPDLQFLMNPALTDETDFIAVLGLRARVSF